MDSKCKTKAEGILEKRIIWIDICKGIAIFLMILGHISGIPTKFRSVIFSFHMPLFFLVNGYLIRHYRVKETFLRSLKTLMKPYVIICIIEALLSGFFASDFSSAGNSFLSGLNDLVVGMSKTSTSFQKYVSVWLVWFVICLFATRNIYILIRNFACSRSVQNIIIVTFAVVGCYIGKNVAFLPWSIDVSMVSIVFIAAGDELSYWNPEKKTKVFISIAALGLWILLLYYGASLELAVRKYPLDILCFICAFTGSFVVMVISQGVEKIPLFSNFWAWLGKNSMIILAVHCLEMRFFRWNEWVYQPLGISPGWMLDFVTHLILILFITYAYLGLKKCIKALNNRINKEEKKETGRLDWPDVAKGICILSVIIGHLGVAWINRIVFMYHLPVYFLLAGYFLKKKEKEGVFVCKKAKRLLVPYTFTCIIISLIAAIKAHIAGLSVRSAIKEWCVAALYGAGDNWTKPFPIKGIGAIWFLLAMFFALVIVHFFIDKRFYKGIIIVIAFVGWFSFDKTNVWLPLSIQAGMFASLYLLIGYEAKQEGFGIHNMKLGLMSVLFLIAVFSIQHFNGFWLVHNYLGNGFVDLFGSLAASVIIIAVSMYICQHSTIGKHILKFFGENSLTILCAHLIELNVLKLNPLSDKISSIMKLNNNYSTVLLIFFKMLFVLVAVLLTNSLKRMLCTMKHGS